MTVHHIDLRRQNGNGNGNGNEVTRYSLDQYANDVWMSFQGNRYLLNGSSSGWTKTEDIEASFTSYISSLYKSNGIVFAIILARMLLFTEGRFCWFDVGDNGEDGRPAGRKGLDVLEKPWPNCGTGELLARMEQDVSLGGNFYAVREGDRLRRLRPDWVTIVLTAPPAESTYSDVAGYWYHPGRSFSNAGEPGRGDDVYLPDEVVHFSPVPDPDAQYRGMSWLTPVVREVMADKSAMEHKLNFFMNGATFGAIISAKESLTNQQYKEWKANFEGIQSGVGNAYRTLFLASPVDTSVTTANMQQLDFKVTVGAGETRLCAAGGVPPIIVGLSEGLASATYSNYGMARRKFGDHWAHPQWKMASTALSTVVDPPKDDLRLGVNTKGIAFLREDALQAAEILQIRASTISTLITAGYKPDSAAVYAETGDPADLQHTGLTSVQLLPPGTQDTDGDGRPDAEVADESEYEALLEEMRADFADRREIVRKFNPRQPRDRRGRWTLTGAIIAALKVQGGEQGGAYFDDDRYLDWSAYDPDEGTYSFEVGGGPDQDPVQFELDDPEMERLFGALSVTRLRDTRAGESSSQMAVLIAVGETDGVTFGDEGERGYLDWSGRTSDGGYVFEVGGGGDVVQFDLSPAEMDKLIASLALSTQTREDVGDVGRAEIQRDRYDVRNPAGSKGGGRFRKLSDAIVALLKDWDGEGDPLADFNQKQLKTAATQLGIDVPPRSNAPKLKTAILGKVRGGKSPARKVGPEPFNSRRHPPGTRVQWDDGSGDPVRGTVGRKGRFTVIDWDSGKQEKVYAGINHDDITVIDESPDAPDAKPVKKAAAKKAPAKKATPRAPAKKAAPKSPDMSDDARNARADAALERLREVTDYAEARELLLSTTSEDDRELIWRRRIQTPQQRLAISSVETDQGITNRIINSLVPDARKREGPAPIVAVQRDAFWGLSKDQRARVRDRVSDPKSRDQWEAALQSEAPGEVDKQRERHRIEDEKVEKARARQADIDTARNYAHLAATLDELTANEASDATLLSRLEASVKRGDLPEAEVAPILAAVRERREVEVENRVRAAYVAVLASRGITARPGDTQWVGLADLRDEIGESVNRHELDDAMRRMSIRDRDVNLVPESNQKMLRDVDREAAVSQGNQAKHAIAIDDPSPRTKPDARPLVAALLASRGITQDGNAGESGRFDPQVHAPIDGSIRQGAAVEVVRPGFSLDRDGERIRLSKAVVEEAGEAPGLPRTSDEAYEQARDVLSARPDGETANQARQRELEAQRLIQVGRRMEEAEKARQLSDLQADLPAGTLTGAGALDAVPVQARVREGANMDSSTWTATGFDGLPKTDRDAVQAVTRYLRTPGFANERLRSPAGDSPLDDRHIAALDRVMDQSRLSSPIVAFRGVGSGVEVPDDSMSFEWTDAGFVSTSVDRGTAEHSFAGSGLLLEMRVPEGTPALGLRGLGEGEVLLGRGLTFRVVGDRGRTSGGARHLVVEVVSPSGDEADPLSSLRTLDPEAARDALDLRKVPELKAMLREQGLPVSGRKRELVDRLVGHLHPGDSPTQARRPDDTPPMLRELERRSMADLRRLAKMSGSASTSNDRVMLARDIRASRLRAWRVPGEPNAESAAANADEELRRMLQEIDAKKQARVRRSEDPNPDDITRAEDEPEDDDPGEPDDEMRGRAQACLDDCDEDAEEPDDGDYEMFRAAGADTNLGGERLHYWWTKGPGLKRWAGSPHPWTTLYTQLLDKVHNVGKAKRMASRWFIEVFGYAAGSDKHRVASGKPPRGKRIGPG